MAMAAIPSSRNIATTDSMSVEPRRLSSDRGFLRNIWKASLQVLHDCLRGEDKGTGVGGTWRQQADNSVEEKEMGGIRNRDSAHAYFTAIHGYEHIPLHSYSQVVGALLCRKGPGKCSRILSSIQA